MRYILENEQIKAEIESFGGELKSLVDKGTGQEYMWEADPAFWGKTSPVLFPFIGKLESASYEYEKKRYEIEKHGFARDMEFAVAEREADRITFYIESNEDTLKNFPFPFDWKFPMSWESVESRKNGASATRGREPCIFPWAVIPLLPVRPKAEKRTRDCAGRTAF